MHIVTEKNETNRVIYKKIKILKSKKLKGTPNCQKIFREMRAEILLWLGDYNEKQIGGYVVHKGYYNEKPYIQIYTRESWRSSQSYLANR